MTMIWTWLDLLITAFSKLCPHQIIKQDQPTPQILPLLLKMEPILLPLPLRMVLATDLNMVVKVKEDKEVKDKDKETEIMEPIPKNLAQKVLAKIMLVKTLVKDKDKDKVKVKDRDKDKDKDRDRVRTKANKDIIKVKIKVGNKVQDKDKMHLLDLWQTDSIQPIRLKVNSRMVNW